MVSKFKSNHMLSLLAKKTVQKGQNTHVSQFSTVFGPKGKGGQMLFDLNFEARF